MLSETDTGNAEVRPARDRIPAKMPPIKRGFFYALPPGANKNLRKDSSITIDFITMSFPILIL